MGRNDDTTDLDNAIAALAAIEEIIATTRDAIGPAVASELQKEIGQLATSTLDNLQGGRARSAARLMPPVVKVVHYKRRGDLPAWIPCAECVAALVTERRAERDAILDGAHGTIDAWERETGARASPAERRFVELVREARALGVGYGFMRQVIGWEWKSTDPIGYIDDARIAEHAIAELRRALAAGATL